MWYVVVVFGMRGLLVHSYAHIRAKIDEIGSILLTCRLESEALFDLFSLLYPSRLKMHSQTASQLSCPTVIHLLLAPLSEMEYFNASESPVFMQSFHIFCCLVNPLQLQAISEVSSSPSIFTHYFFSIQQYVHNQMLNTGSRTTHYHASAATFLKGGGVVLKILYKMVSKWNGYLVNQLCACINTKQKNLA